MGDGGAWKAAGRVAAGQHGVLSRAQARAVGLSERQIERQVTFWRWTRELPGVYRLEAAPRTWRGDLAAACLWTGASSVVSHHAAAALHGLEGFAEGPVVLTVNRYWRRQPGVELHRTRALSPRDRTHAGGFPVTSVARTLVDLAAVEPMTRVRAAADDALRRKLLTVEALEAAIERSAPRHGTRTLRRIVAELRGQGGPTHSALERRVVDLLVSEGFPAPVRQHRVRARGRARRLDLLIPGTRVVIEADGYAHHSSVTVFEDDRSRNNSLLARGYLVLHWTWTALEERPHVLVDELRAVLGQLGFRAAA